MEIWNEDFSKQFNLCWNSRCERNITYIIHTQINVYIQIYKRCSKSTCTLICIWFFSISFHWVLSRSDICFAIKYLLRRNLLNTMYYTYTIQTEKIRCNYFLRSFPTRLIEIKLVCCSITTIFYRGACMRFV